jgi:hypothetical protein
LDCEVTLPCRKERLLVAREVDVSSSSRVFGSWGSIFTPWECRTPDFGDVVASANNTPVLLRRRNHNMAL